MLPSRYIRVSMNLEPRALEKAARAAVRAIGSSAARMVALLTESHVVFVGNVGLE